MSLFGWWHKRKIKPPEKIEMPEREGTGNHSAEVVKESKQKLQEAIKTKKEVSQLLKVNDQFAEALQKSMRRANG